MQTIQDWEDARFAREAATEIEAIPTIEPVRDIERPDEGDRPTLVALKGRVTAGLGVQLLAEPIKAGRTFITLAINGATETFEVDPAYANEAFAHPYCFGGTLPIR